VRDADHFGPICPQTGVVADGSEPDYIFGHIEALPMSEDCLVLNLWTPAADARARPVMVWLHGRGFREGAGSEPPYHGAALARRGDVVVITVNHRLNIFGSLHLDALDDETFSGSEVAGMLDIVLALQWIRENVAAFGGDPGNVTVFGESGGGFKVGTLMAMPAARGLFHSAIVQSGPVLQVLDRERADAMALTLLERLGLDDPKALLELPMADILWAIDEAPRLNFIPVAGGPHLPQHPFHLEAAPSSIGVPLLIGSNRDEMTLFTLGDPLRGAMTREQVAERLQDSLGDHTEQVIEAYEASRPEASPWEIYIAIISDGRFRYAAKGAGRGCGRADQHADEAARRAFRPHLDAKPSVLYMTKSYPGGAHDRQDYPQLH